MFVRQVKVFVKCITEEAVNADICTRGNTYPVHLATTDRCFTGQRRPTIPRP